MNRIVRSVFLGVLWLAAACGEPTPPEGDAECAGKEDGTACGSVSASACDAPDTCRAGFCVSNTAPDGTPCGDNTATACNKADSCVSGLCNPNYALVGTACGDPSDSVCDRADACDGLGNCETHVAADGTACGDSSASECDAPDTCLAGECAPNPVAEGTACGDESETTCTLPDLCDGMGSCDPRNVEDGTPCGDSTASACDQADACIAGECSPQFVQAGTPCGDGSDAQCDHADTCTGTGACAGNVEPDGTLCADCALGIGQCGTCAMGSCPDACTRSSALTTRFTGGNSQNGNMFDVTATQALTIKGITIFPGWSGSEVIEVYTVSGGITGQLSTQTAWTKVAAVPVNSPAADMPLPLPFTFNIALAANTTTGFYVTATGGRTLSYTDGTGVGNVTASDSLLSIHEGYGVQYPFSTTYSPRIWNGTLDYAIDGTLSSTATGTVQLEGEMFNLTALQTTRIKTLAVDLAAGTHDVNVYFRPGGHVGFENDPTAWTAAGSFTGLAGGPDVPLALSNEVVIPQGTTYGFYVTSTTAGGAILSSPGTTIGDVVTSDARLELKEGVAVPGTFGGAGAVQAWSGVASWEFCP